MIGIKYKLSAVIVVPRLTDNVCFDTATVDVSVRDAEETIALLPFISAVSKSEEDVGGFLEVVDFSSVVAVEISTVVVSCPRNGNAA